MHPACTRLTLSNSATDCPCPELQVARVSCEFESILNRFPFRPCHVNSQQLSPLAVQSPRSIRFETLSVRLHPLHITTPPPRVHHPQKPRLRTLILNLDSSSIFFTSSGSIINCVLVLLPGPRDLCSRDGPTHCPTRISRLPHPPPTSRSLPACLPSEPHSPSKLQPRRDLVHRTLQPFNNTAACQSLVPAVCLLCAAARSYSEHRLVDLSIRRRLGRHHLLRAQPRGPTTPPPNHHMR